MNAERASAAVDRIYEEAGLRCEFVKTNIGSSSDIEQLFDRTLSVFPQLDILVNCAGICTTMSVEEIDGNQWDKVLSINLRGTYLCSREALKRMKAQRNGKIVNVSSISGRIGGIATGIDYCTSKGGIITLTMSLAKIGGPFNINVNAVAPGFIDTEMTKNFTHFNPEAVPLRRIGKPEDVADVIVFLASERSRYITGETIDVNGGVYMT